MFCLELLVLNHCGSEMELQKKKNSLLFMLLCRRDLKKVLKTDMRRVNETELRKYTMDVLRCLQLLRTKKIIHGDIKPVKTGDSEKHVTHFRFYSCHDCHGEPRTQLSVSYCLHRSLIILTLFYSNITTVSDFIRQLL